jgi:heme-degrading monooxygenase HmoA
MILEHAVLHVMAGREAEFEAALNRAVPLISVSPGFLEIEVRRNAKVPNQYLLLARWEKIEDHTEGFRKSERYMQWKALLHGFYDPFPVVEHFGIDVIHS